jgi:hypothetical protein
VQFLERLDSDVRVTALESVHLVLARAEHFGEFDLRNAERTATLHDSASDLELQWRVLIGSSNLGITQQSSLHIVLVHFFTLLS